MYKNIIALFPPHQTYVEPFGGAAWVLLNKEPSPVEVYNDIDGDVVNLFWALRERGEELQRLLQLTPYAREGFIACLDNCDNSLERARRTFVRFRQGFNGKGGTPADWHYNISLSRRGIAAVVSQWLSAIDDVLPQVVARLRLVQIEQRDALDMITRYDRPETLFYCDPPYMAESRVDTRSYDHEMSDEKHHQLLAILRELRGMVVLSGYHCSLYDETLSDWERREFNIVARSSGVCKTRDGKGGQAPRRTEVVWLNPAIVERLSQTQPEQLELVR